MINENQKNLTEYGQSTIDFDIKNYNFYKLILDDFNKYNA